MNARTRFLLAAAAAYLVQGFMLGSRPALIAAADALPVFTAEQAESGKAAFAKHCASCHMPDLSGDNDVPQLAGSNFMSTWRHKTTKDLFDYMSGAMPPGAAPLTPESYASITAFILESNGARPGSTRFDGLTVVTIESAAGPVAP